MPWLGWTCGICDYCRSERENLCDRARFTGYTLDGGCADYMVADARFCFPIPHGYPDVQAAPLLCAGLIGNRSLRAAGHGPRLGVFGLDAAAHIVAQGGPIRVGASSPVTRLGDIAWRHGASDSRGA